MAKGPNDIILRDRLEFTLTGGSLGLVWGRINLDDYVNPLTNQGLDIKEIFIQPRTNGGSGEVATQLTNTGNFWAGTGFIPATTGDSWSAMKVVASTRAYQSMSDIGIGSPDVYHCETWTSQNSRYIFTSGVGDAGSLSQQLQHERYGVKDLHPAGAPIVSDLLIGVAADNLSSYDDTDILYLDVQLVASPTKINSKQLTEMLTQGQDL
jgi:hypothetical protein|tara:strand:- start:145 stop:771 length:627 start_codon:yes stop_codon:yes gene_type:complete